MASGDRRNYQVLSFFCGAGGLDLGFSQAGFDVIFAADYDDAAIETHNSNAAVPSATKLDLQKAKASDVIAYLDRLPQPIAPVGIIGGPPCQGFSRANTQRTHDDPRNQLARHYASMIIALADVYPIEFFVFENVPEILAEQNSALFEALKRKLAQRFKISVSILNAADFGVPQKRERAFIVGLRKEINGEEKFEFPVPLPGPRPTVRKTIEHMPEPVYFDRSLKAADIPYHPNHWTMQPRSSRFSENLVSTSRSRSLIRLQWDKPSRTVAYGNREIHVHPSGLRRLSILEAMLLQGFPHDYELRGNLSQQVTQVSNAVPPPVAKAIAEKIQSYLSRKLTR